MRNVIQKKFLVGSFFSLGAGLIAGIILSPHRAIAVGGYEEGVIVATHAVPEGMMVHDRTFSWDLTRGIITFVRR